MSCWQQLGLVGPCDRRSIKRAYMQRLKVNRPEDDPEGFQRLHNAYEQALAWAESGAAPPRENDTAAPEEEPLVSLKLQFDTAAGWQPATMSADTDTVEPEAEEEPGLRPLAAFDREAHIEAVWALLEAGDQQAARQRLYSDINRLHLDSHAALEAAWYHWLMQQPVWPDDADELVCEALGWQQDAGAMPEGLRQHRQKVYDRQFLQDLATGSRAHTCVDQRSARLLLAQKVETWRWLWLRGLTRKDAQSFEWVQKNLPDFLPMMKPEVLAWWRRPRALETERWYLMLFALTLVLTRGLIPPIDSLGHNLPLGLITLPCVLGCILLAYVVVRSLAWLRVQLVVRVIWPLLAKDRFIESKLPGLAQLTARFRLRVWSDFMLCFAFWALQVVLLLPVDSFDAFAHAYNDLGPTSGAITYWAICRVGLWLLEMAPGANFWRQANGR